MKHLKTYENLLDDYSKKEEELREIRKELKKLLTKYLYLNRDKWDEWNIIEYEDHEIKVLDYDFLLGGSLSIEYECYDDETDEAVIDKEDLKDLRKFLDNPDLYANAKKYNL